VKVTEPDLEACCEQIEDLGGEYMVAIDLLGGPATMLEAVLLGRGQREFFLPVMALNRVQDAYQGEHKSDVRDARVIAEQLRMRWRSLRELRAAEEATVEMRTLVS
jgi:hypothetical protein